MKRDKIRRCKYCGQEVKVNVGINNWKNLFRKPTLDEWITLFIIIMMIVSTYVYKYDIQNITEYYESGDYCLNQLDLSQQQNLKENDLVRELDLGDFSKENG